MCPTSSVSEWTLRLDPDLVNSVIRAESGFNPAPSPQGCQGLMQFDARNGSKLWVPNAFDPAANVNGGTRYLRELLERYNYDLIKALAAITRDQTGRTVPRSPPYRETRAYVCQYRPRLQSQKIAQQKAARLARQRRAAGPKRRPRTRTRNKTCRPRQAETKRRLLAQPRHLRDPLHLPQLKRCPTPGPLVDPGLIVVYLCCARRSPSLKITRVPLSMDRKRSLVTGIAVAVLVALIYLQFPDMEELRLATIPEPDA